MFIQIGCSYEEILYDILYYDIVQIDSDEQIALHYITSYEMLIIGFMCFIFGQLLDIKNMKKFVLVLMLLIVVVKIFNSNLVNIDNMQAMVLIKVSFQVLRILLKFGS